MKMTRSERTILEYLATGIDERGVKNRNGDFSKRYHEALEALEERGVIIRTNEGEYKIAEEYTNVLKEQLNY